MPNSCNGILELQLRDTVNARVMQPDGSYVKVKPLEGQPPVDSQMAMYGYFQHGWEPRPETVPQRPAPAPPCAPAGQSGGKAGIFAAVPRHL